MGREMVHVLVRLEAFRPTGIFFTQFFTYFT